MKTYTYIIAILLMACLGYSCDDNWDGRDSLEFGDGETAVFVNSSLIDYIKSEPSLSNMYELFEKTGIANEIASKKQLYTLLVVSDENTGSITPDTITAQMHVCGASLSPSELPDGQRLLMWSGKYVTISLQANPDNGETTIYMNGIKVKKVIKTTDAFIYEVESLIPYKLSVYEYLQTLGEDYSLFKEMVLEKSTQIFDSENSIPLYLDETGNTVYDSVWLVSNPFFDLSVEEADQKINILSEFKKSTMFIPTNEILETALENAYLTISNALGRDITAEDTAKMEEWVIYSMFYNTELTPENYYSQEDWKSAYGQQWRTTVQKINTALPIELSNGMVYYVDYMKVPNNMLIYRIKQHFKFYDNCTEEEKTEYFKCTNYNDTIATPKKVALQTGGFTPLPGVWPMIEYYCFLVEPFTGFTFEFTGLILNSSNRVEKALIPPGEYDLCMGFKEKLNYKVDIYVNNKKVNNDPINLSGSTFQYDRSAGGYPEGFDTKTPPGMTNATKYDRDGGKIGTVKFEGTDMQPIVIRIEANGTVPAKSKFYAFHWCLKPTGNNY